MVCFVRVELVETRKGVVVGCGELYCEEKCTFFVFVFEVRTSVFLFNFFFLFFSFSRGMVKNPKLKLIFQKENLMGLNGLWF